MDDKMKVRKRVFLLFGYICCQMGGGYGQRAGGGGGGVGGGRERSLEYSWSPGRLAVGCGMEKDLQAIRINAVSSRRGRRAVFSGNPSC